MENTAVHPFEKAGLGKAPFRFVGHEYRVGPISISDGTTVGSPGQPMGTCDYCYTGIADCCMIRDKNGKTFVVGNVCVNKVGEAKLSKAADTEVKKARREREKSRKASRIKNAQELLEGSFVLEASLREKDHPTIPGKTLLDYVEWMFRYAGTAGKLKVSRIVEKTEKEINESE